MPIQHYIMMQSDVVAQTSQLVLDIQADYFFFETVYFTPFLSNARSNASSLDINQFRNADRKNRHWRPTFLPGIVPSRAILDKNRTDTPSI